MTEAMFIWLMSSLFGGIFFALAVARIYWLSNRKGGRNGQ
jgi:hypothetical protein